MTGSETPTEWLISPSEPVLIQRLGITSSIPEHYGADLLYTEGGIKVGVQRKTCTDLVASVIDGRLAKELLQVNQLDMAVLVVEGRWVWTADGTWMESRRSHRQYTRAMYWGLRFSCASKGIHVLETSSLSETRDLVRVLGNWLGKKTHPEAWRRPSPDRGEWGQRSSRDWMLHLLMGFEFLGPVLSGRIIDTYPNPLRWTVTEEDLMDIEGIGPKRAKQLIEALNDQS